MIVVEARATSYQLGLSNQRQYEDTNFGVMNEILTSLTFHMKVVEEITRNWNLMEQELNTINTEIDALCNAQTALHNLMEGVVQQLDDLAGKELMCKGPIEESMSFVDCVWV